MTRRPDEHLSPDDIDAWLAGHPGSAAQAHVDACEACREVAVADRELIEQPSPSLLRPRSSPTR